MDRTKSSDRRSSADSSLQLLARWSNDLRRCVYRATGYLHERRSARVGRSFDVVADHRRAWRTAWSGSDREGRHHHWRTSTRGDGFGRYTGHSSVRDSLR